MNPKTLFPVAAAIAAALFNLTVVAPVHAQGKAALVRDVDRPTLQPVTGACETYDAKCVLYKVPAGKRLVVETVSYKLPEPKGVFPRDLVFGTDDPHYANLTLSSPNTYAVNATFAYYQGGDQVSLGTQALRIYIDENQSFSGGCNHDGIYLQNLAFSGYLVDK